MLRRADIQGLRALAILLVIAHHAGMLSGGFIGVDVFFVISGYVISRLLVAELEQRGTVSLAHFYARRARRLLPALALVLTCVCLVSVLLLSPLGPQQQAVRTAIGASTFTANIEQFLAPKGYFDPETSTNALLHTWSLAVEEQFYLVFPITLLAAWRCGRRSRRNTVVVVAVISSLSFALSWLTSHGRLATVTHAFGGGATEFAFYAPVTRAWEFGAGVLVCLARRTLTLRPLASWVGAAGLALVALGALTITPDDPFPGTVALLPVLGTALVLVAGAPGAITTRLLSTRPLVWIGDISYGWYIWHWPLIVFAAAAWPHEPWGTMLASLVSLGLGWLSFRFVENPLRISSSGRRTALLSVVCIGLSLLAALGLHLVTKLEAGAARVQFVARALEPHADEVRGCSHGVPLDSRPACTWGPDGPKVVLVGDSNAGHFTEPAAAAAIEGGFTFSVATRSSCPFVELLVEVPRRDAASCLQFVRDTMKTLIAQRPALVFIASASTTYVHHGDIVFRDPGSGAVADSPREKQAQWEAGVRALVTRLDAAGIPTVLVHAVPRLEALTLASCPFIKMHYDARSCGVTIERAAIERQQAAVREAERRAVAGLSHAAALDVTDQLCSPTMCDSLRDDEWLYRDDGHLTVRAAEALRPAFARFVAESARR